MEPGDPGCQQGNLGNRAEQPACCRESTAGYRRYHAPLGPIMKVKNFRLNIVFASSVTVLWGLSMSQKDCQSEPLTPVPWWPLPLILYTNLSSF